MLLETKFCPTTQTDLNTIEAIKLDTKGQMVIFESYQAHMPNLKHLALSNQNYPSWNFQIHPEFPIHDSLESVDILGYSLSQKLPNFITKAKNLKSLALHDCQISNFPKELLQIKSLEHLDLAHNPITELPDTLFKLPQLKSMGIGSNNWTVETWEKFLRQLAQNPQITHFKLACSPLYPTNISFLSQLKSLEIHANTLYFKRESGDDELASLHPEAFFSQLKQLPHLEELSICTHISTDSLLQIAQIRSLKVLKLWDEANASYYNDEVWGNFTQLRELHLEDIDTMPESFNLLTNLEELYLYHSFPFHLHLSTSLKKLHTLVFKNSTNKIHTEVFKSASADFLALIPQLKQFHLDYPSSFIVKQIKDVQKIAQTHASQIQLISALICQKDVHMYPTTEFFQLLNCKKAKLNELAWQEIENRLGNSASIPHNAKKFYFFGKPNLVSPAEMKGYFEKLDLKQVKKAEDTDCVIVFPNSNTSPNKDDLTKAFTEKQFIAWLEQKAGVERLNQTESQNVSSLLRSNDPNNIILGLELLQKSYQPNPQVDACIIALGLFSQNKSIKETAKKFIKKNLASPLSTLFTKVAQRGRDHEKPAYLAFVNHQDIDRLCFAEVCFRCLDYYRYISERLGAHDIIEIGGDCLSEAISSLQYGHSAIYIPKTTEKLHPTFGQHIPKEYSEVFCGSKHPEIYPSLFSGSSIKSLYLDHEGDFIHPDIGNLSSLKVLSIEMPTLKQVPETVGELKTLESLTFKVDKMSQIADAFRPCSKVSGVFIISEAFTEFPEWLPKWHLLSEISLMDSKKLSNIDVLFRLKNLKVLSLTDINFGLLRITTRSTACLEELTLEHDYMSDDISDDYHQIIPAFLEANASSLNKLTLDKISCVEVVDKIGGCSKLEYLSLKNANISSLPDSIVGAPLKEINLCNNPLEKFPEILSQIPTLKIVELPYKLEKQKTKLQKAYPHIHFSFGW